MICRVNGALNKTLIEPHDSLSAGRMPAANRGRSSDFSERVYCFHCGEPCPSARFVREEEVFCCQGCLAVHELLAGAGLEHFYQLGDHPGVRVRGASRRGQWTYLDDPKLQQRFLDFTDGTRSRVTFRIPAIHCVACVWLLENLFRLHPGIGRSAVQFARREATIDFVADRIRLSELVALLASIGYEPALTLAELGKRPPPSLRKRQWIQVGIAGFAFGNIMLFSLPAYLGLDALNGGGFKGLFGCLSLALALPVLLYSASDYWESARLSLRRRVLTLEVPISLGLAALYAWSAYEIVSGRGAGYLDSLVGLVFFLLCGRAFQQKTHDRLAFDRDYKSFFPLSVARRTGGAEESVAISDLRVGDRIVLRNGELIPADAILVRGRALVDYSFVTGESEPVPKDGGDYLYAGGRQIGGRIEVETAKPVSQSYLTSLWNHEAFRKAPGSDVQSLTNRYSRRFTLIVVGVAVGAGVFWLLRGDPARAIKAFTTVLIVACPCALALAAPFTLGTAQRAMSRLGVFLRNGLVIERMAQVNAIVFDKTGTLTAPRSAGVCFQGEPLQAAEEGRIFSLARQSRHPHSVRISEWLPTGCSPQPVESFRETPGCGLEAMVGGREVLLGSAAWLESHGVGVAWGSTLRMTGPPASPGGAGARTISGSAVHVAIGGRHRGAFLLSSSLRPETGLLLRELGGRYEVTLLSGDNEKERDLFMGLFGGASRLNFNQSPLDKLAFIQRLQDSGRVVMMVGDGLNDAGALRQSDIGVAVVESIGAFSPASDVILEGGRVPCLNSILLMARDATRIVRLSFGISAFYNLAGIGVAASGLLSPLVCAVLMPLSSLSVVLFACGATAWRARKRFDGFDRVTSDRVGRGLSAGRSSDLAGPDLEGRRAVTGASLGAGFAKEGAA